MADKTRYHRYEHICECFSMLSVKRIQNFYLKVVNRHHQHRNFSVNYQTLVNVYQLKDKIEYELNYFYDTNSSFIIYE
jgi:hypothetical protein